MNNEKKDDPYEKKISEEKKKMLDKLIKMNPELAYQKNELYEEFLGKTPIPEVNTKEIVLDVIKFRDKLYFKDNINRLLDSSASQVGVYDIELKKCILFSDINKISMELPNNLKSIK